MKVTYEHKPDMTFIGFSTAIRPEEGYQKCPEFWDREYAQKYARLWQTMQPETAVEKAILENGVGLFAICDEKAGSFEYWIAGLYQGGQVPEGLKLYTFPESDWAMFSAKGPLPGSLQSLNTQVWQEWYPTEGQNYHAASWRSEHFYGMSESLLQKKQLHYNSHRNITNGGMDMKLVKATEQDFPRITRFYRDVIAHTEHMDTYARWVYGQHPTDEMILGYIREGAMYCCEKDGTLLSALAVTPQAEDYHGAAWSVSLEDDEVAVVHLLCVAPEWQGKGVARMTMQQIMAMSREMGKRAVRLDALACNTPAHRLYKSLGFQKRDQRRWYADNVGWADFFLFEMALEKGTATEG